MLELTRRHPLTVFFLLAYALTWAIEIPMCVFDVRLLQVALGWMPGLAAIFVTAAVGGPVGFRACSVGL